MSTIRCRQVKISQVLTQLKFKINVSFHTLTTKVANLSVVYVISISKTIYSAFLQMKLRIQVLWFKKKLIRKNKCHCFASVQRDVITRIPHRLTSLICQGYHHPNILRYHETLLTIDTFWAILDYLLYFEF